MHEAGHPKPASGTIQRDGVERDLGAGFRMGGHMCTLWLIHIDV